jgi:hypothetical protein
VFGEGKIEYDGPVLLTNNAVLGAALHDSGMVDSFLLVEPRGENVNAHVPEAAKSKKEIV